MLVDKLPDLANVVVGGAIVGQLLSDRPFSMRVALIGIGVWALFVGGAFYLGRRRKT